MSTREGGKPRETCTVWNSLKKSFQTCRPEPMAAAEPRPKRNTCSSACSRSLSNLRDVIHGSKRHTTECRGDDDDNKPPPSSYSPRSLGSSDFLNVVSHDVVLSDSTCELKITGKVSPATLISGIKLGNEGGGFDLSPPRRKSVNGVGNEKPSRFRTVPDVESDGSSPLQCKKCSVQFKNVEDVEEHHVSEHAVTELGEGDSSRRVVEIICRTNDTSLRIDRVLKVNNTNATLSRFEEHRETVRTNATKLPTKHPRCLADGNELLRFHGTNVSCPLGSSSSFVLCTMEDCGVCLILRNGFSNRELTGNVGVFTASTSKKAIEKTSSEGGGRNALVLCRVIAGRVHKPVENIQEVVNQSGFDSLAGKFGQPSSIEELFLLDPKALLPCFVVICRP